MPFTLDELKRILAMNLDPEVLLEKLQISAEELLDRFSDKLIDFRYEFEDYDDEFDSMVEYERESYEPDPDDHENMQSMGFNHIYEAESFED